MSLDWPQGRVFRVTPAEDAPLLLRRVLNVPVYAADRAQMRTTLRVLAILAARSS